MTLLARVIAVLLVAGAQPALAVTDCSRAKTGVERLLCSNDRVALADHVMARAFRDALNRSSERREELIEDQERWRKSVRDACPDVPCLMRVYEDRTSELETW